MGPDVELHIDELVVHDLPPGGRDAFAAALIAALEPALAAHGLGPWAIDGAAVDRLTVDVAAPPAAARPAGAAIGAALATTLAGPPERAR